jgi:hypothetical protein
LRTFCDLLPPRIGRFLGRFAARILCAATSFLHIAAKDGTRDTSGIGVVPAFGDLSASALRAIFRATTVPRKAYAFRLPNGKTLIRGAEFSREDHFKMDCIALARTQGFATQLRSATYFVRAQRIS